jgi:SpoVK/Ycf46/Vps4 family AAA+-type ATPase
MEYHIAKALIEEKIGEYRSKSLETKLPKIKIERSGDKTEIRFDIGKDADLYDVEKTFLKTIGEMTVGESMGSLHLSNKDTRIYIYNSFGCNSISLSKNSDLTPQEMDSILSIYEQCNCINEKKSPKQTLTELGTIIYDSDDNISFDYIAGYVDVKEEIRDTVILPLNNPQAYEKIINGTRKKYETILPKAVLFEGPPGTGKTTFARIIAKESGNSMVYVPVESIMSKWFGESERNLSKIFDACNDMKNSILFLDEIDSLATSRENNLHEATRRVLSVLLRKIDGFETNKSTILIGATNRKNDLDGALLSRFDASIYFHLPDLQERAKIFENYAKQLCESELLTLSRESEGISGRNIKDVCEHAERRWASKLIKSEEYKELPDLNEYLASLKKHMKNNYNN